MAEASKPRGILSSKDVWKLMVTNLDWSAKSLDELQVKVHSNIQRRRDQKVKVQLFELIVTALFAHLRPDYDWWITPNRPDGGIDFIGRSTFLTSEELGIEAAITIGGQCKKRERVDNVVNLLAGSLVRMSQRLHPTFFVAVLSAPLTAQRVHEATHDLEQTLQRHCHILDRRQIEGLIRANFFTARAIIKKALPDKTAGKVLEYFQKSSDVTVQLSIEEAAPRSVLAGEPFRVRLTIVRNSLTEARFRLVWSQGSQGNAVQLVAPSDLVTNEGRLINFSSSARENPFTVLLDLEFVVYAVGLQVLGSVRLESATKQEREIANKKLSTVQVIENLAPPFYDEPYREPLDELERAFQRAETGRLECVAVVGAGGAGKTRLCQEMALTARRNGAYTVSARQAHSMEFPRRILANFLLDIAAVEGECSRPAKRIAKLLASLEPSLAEKAKPSVEALCGLGGRAGSLEDDQTLLSVFLVLLARLCRSNTVVVHLHDLHWCTLDVLDFFDRLIWQLEHLRLEARTADGPAPPSGLRILFLLEGRMHEHRKETETGWSTRMFERFIGRMRCSTASCRPFEPRESEAFTNRLFEQEHSASLMLPRSLLELQRELIGAIHRVAGGNPLHLLEQVKLLQQHGILAQNLRTGLIYMVKPDFRRVRLPTSVLDTIEARWQYYRIHDHPLATLLWAAALVDDNLPLELFRYLWGRLAPDVTQTAIESTEFIRFPDRLESGSRIIFRHENFVHALRRVQLANADRQKVVDSYSQWFEQIDRFSPELRYMQARVNLEGQHPNLPEVRRYLRLAHRGALQRQDRSLESRILATLLDSVTWPMHAVRPLSKQSLTKALEDEIVLCRRLKHSGRPDVAQDRIDKCLDVVDDRLRKLSARRQTDVEDLREKKFKLVMMKAENIYHDRRPAEALPLTSAAIIELRGLLAASTLEKNQRWLRVFMEVQHTHAAAYAFAGDLRKAVPEISRAAEIAHQMMAFTPRALEVMITYANILLCESPQRSEEILLECFELAEPPLAEEEVRLRVQVNLAMAQMVIAYQAGLKGTNDARLRAAHEHLLYVFKRAHPLARLKDAAASSLLLGILCVIRRSPDSVDWFAQAVSLATRSRQLETLWRAHINLAHSLSQNGLQPEDSAAAALELMSYSLDAYEQPDRTPRFNLLAVPMAHAARYLLVAEDPRAFKAFQKYPALRSMFEDIGRAKLRADRGGYSSHEWFRLGDVEYVIY